MICFNVRQAMNFGIHFWIPQKTLSEAAVEKLRVDGGAADIEDATVVGVLRCLR